MLLDEFRCQAFLARGLAHATRGDIEHALADFNEAIRLDPKSPTAYVNRGILYKTRVSSIARPSGDGKSEAAKAEYEKAFAEFTEAIRLDPNDRFAFYNRATLYGLIDTAAYGESKFCGKRKPRRSANPIAMSVYPLKSA